MVEWKPLIRSRVDLVFHCEWMEAFFRVFGSVVVVAFQNIFRSEKCVNNIFLFFKNYF
jgi:hypothetical protein